MRSLAAAVLLSCTALSFGQPASKRTLSVAADGSGQFRTVQEAVDSAPGGHVRIEINPGEYRQVLSITADGVELRGLGKKPGDVVLVYDNSAGTAGGTSKSATVTVSGDDFIATNLTISNDFEKRHARSEQGSQAVALLALGDRDVFRNVRLLGAQDTLYANSKTCHAAEPAVCRASRQYFADCYIEGHVDFIFGDAKAVFERCELHALAHSVVALTAQSRLRPEEDSGYVFRNCTVNGDAGVGKIFLGRPWRAYATVIWIDTDFKVAIDPKGWMEWDGRLATADYAEFDSRGLAGDVSLRVLPGRQLRAAELEEYATKTWLTGADGWDAQADAPANANTP